MRWTGELSNLTVHFTIQLILPSLAIRYPITDPRLQDAPSVLAGKLLLGHTSLCLRDLRFRAPLLVLPAIAVILPVTAPPGRDARAVVTLELGRCAAAQLARTIFLIAPVTAVIVAVTSETVKDASTEATATCQDTTSSSGGCRGSPALELALSTEWHWGLAVVLVRAVTAVDLTVTAKGKGHAFTVTTLPLSGITTGSGRKVIRY